MNKLYVIIAIFLFISCNQNSKKQVDETTEKDSSASCAKPIKDPSNPKPMALMMRQMAANADSMRSQLIRGELLDSLRYPFMRFYMVEPTDPNVLEPQFYENARLFQEAYKAQFRAKPKDQIVAYNAAIGKCINCHESYCSGPLKRIRKFPIPIN